MIVTKFWQSKVMGCDDSHQVLTEQGHGLAGFIAVREMSGRNKISQGQGIVREFYTVSGKFLHLAKLMKNVMEFHIMSGENDHFRQHDSPVSIN